MCNLLHPGKPLNIPELKEDWGKGSPPSLQWQSRQGDRERFIFLLFCHSQKIEIFAVKI